MDPVILGIKDISDDTVEVTFGTVDYGQAVCRVQRSMLNDAGTFTMLTALHDRQRGIATMPRRSANPRK